jgi:hypothetical protein
MAAFQCTLVEHIFCSFFAVQDSAAETEAEPPAKRLRLLDQGKALFSSFFPSPSSSFPKHC